LGLEVGVGGEVFGEVKGGDLTLQWNLALAVRGRRAIGTRSYEGEFVAVAVE
jgi:hypothetical protein